MNALIETLNLWGTRFTAFALPMLAQSAVLIVLLFAIDALLRHRVRATIRYALWMVLLLKLILPPTLISPTGLAYWLPQPAADQASAGNSSLVSALLPRNNTAFTQPVSDSPRNLSSTRPARPALTGPAIVFAVWLGALVGLAVVVGWRIRSVVHLLRDTAEASAYANGLLESCCGQLRIRRAIRLRYATAVGSPAICGFFRPVILIPASLPEQLSESELRSVLLHELAHFRRGDLWVGHVQILLQLFYWYNPLLWFANRRIQRLREQAVDEMVLVEMREEADAYPETLLQVAKLTLTRPAFSLGLVGILEPAGNLKERIQFMLHRPLPTTARIGIRGLLLVVMLALVALPMACRKKESAANPLNPTPAEPQILTLNPGQQQPHIEFGLPAPHPQLSAEMQGRKLNAVQARELEAKLVTNPEDLETRIQLLGYYFIAQQLPGNNRQLRQGHILWLVEHHPDVRIPPPYIGLIRQIDGSAYEQGKTLWLKQVQDNPKNPAILENAGDYLLLSADRVIAEDLFKQAQAIDPNNFQLSEKLGGLYALNAMSGDTNSAAKAVSQWEKAEAIDPAGNFNRLGKLAKMSFTSGDLEKARNSATELLRLAPEHQKEWNYGNAIHDGNVILGRVAVRDGKIDEAKKYLLEAGKTTGSPQLNSFGPNMSLAKDLLEKGEKTTVVAYFQLCGKFWTIKGSADTLKKWTVEVNGGLIPDFGANLFY